MRLCFPVHLLVLPYRGVSKCISVLLLLGEQIETICLYDLTPFPVILRLSKDKATCHQGALTSGGWAVGRPAIQFAWD